METENIKMDDLCKDCLILAQCRNKGWLQVLNDCINIVKFIGSYAVKMKDTTVKIPLLRKSFITYKDEAGQILIGPVNYHTRSKK
jgi:hypothetical protein